MREEITLLAVLLPALLRSSSIVRGVLTAHQSRHYSRSQINYRISARTASHLFIEGKGVTGARRKRVTVSSSSLYLTDEEAKDLLLSRQAERP